MPYCYFIVAEKTGFASFKTVFSCYLLLWLIAVIIEGFTGIGIVVWGPSIIASFFAIALRLHIVKRYQIMECKLIMYELKCVFF